MTGLLKMPQMPLLAPTNNDSVWFSWIEYPGYTYGDRTSWKLEIDSHGNLVQNVSIDHRSESSKAKREERDELHSLTFSKDDFWEVQRRVNEIKLHRLAELAPYGQVKDSRGCHLSICSGSYQAEIHTCLTRMFRRFIENQQREELTSSNSGIEDQEFISDVTEIRKLVSLLEWVLTKCPYHKCHWETNGSKWLRRIISSDNPTVLLKITDDDIGSRASLFGLLGSIYRHLRTFQ